MPPTDKPTLKNVLCFNFRRLGSSMAYPFFTAFLLKMQESAYLWMGLYACIYGIYGTFKKDYHIYSWIHPSVDRLNPFWVHFSTFTSIYSNKRPIFPHGLHCRYNVIVYQLQSYPEALWIVTHAFCSLHVWVFEMHTI